MSANILEIQNISKSFKDRKVVDRVSFTVSQAKLLVFWVPTVPEKPQVFIWSSAL